MFNILRSVCSIDKIIEALTFPINQNSPMDMRLRSILTIFGSFVNVFPGVFATEQHLLTVI